MPLTWKKNSKDFKDENCRRFIASHRFCHFEPIGLLPRVFSKIYIPQAVYDEVSIWSKPYSQKLRRFSKKRVETVQNQIAVQLLKKDVDFGEAEAIILALEKGIENLLIDDPKGRKIAQSQGLHPIGSIGVLLQAKKAGLIQEIKPSLDNLIANKFRIGKSLYNKALKLAGEND